MSSAFQIEGAPSIDGRSPSVWDTFGGRGSATGPPPEEKGTDHFNRMEADVALLSQLNVTAYRFSISWPRVQARGSGAINDAGLDFYETLVDRLLDSGIEPHVTLHHWDLPEDLQTNGGWCNRSIIDNFVDYAGAVTSRLGDRVKKWTTINEPFFIADHGYRTGRHAPGISSDREAFAAAHHLLVAHGAAVPIIRAHSPGAEIGIPLSFRPISGFDRSEATESAVANLDGWENQFFIEPIANGRYPEDVASALGWSGSEILDGDMDLIGAPIDFLGVTDCSRQTIDDGVITIEQGSGLPEVLTRLHTRYDFPSLAVLSLGVPTANDRSQRRALDDTLRVRHLETSVSQVLQAVDAGIPVTSLFVRSFLDGLEWEHGQSIAYGLVGLDPVTMERHPKDSFYRYKELIAANADVSAEMSQS